MFRSLILAILVAFGFSLATSPVGAMPSAPAAPAAWRSGYRLRGNSYRGSHNGYSDYSYRRSTGRYSPLDYPPSSQPEATRRHQWNKYPNQPYYLRGERKSLGILP